LAFFLPLARSFPSTLGSFPRLVPWPAASLQTPPHFLHDSPYVPGMVVNISQAAYQFRHPRKRPEICRVSVGGRTTQEFFLHKRQLLGLQARSSSGRRRPVQRAGVPVVPSLPPLTDTLLADPENMSNSSLPLTLLEQCNGFHSPCT
jgi:hypothetical protein